MVMGPAAVFFADERIPHSRRNRRADRLHAAGLSQREAARLLGIDERTMRRYCLGEMPAPRMIWLALAQISQERATDQSTPTPRPAHDLAATGKR